MQDAKRRLTAEDVRNGETVKCEKCGSIYFREVVYIKRISRFVTMEPMDMDVPLGMYKCDECGHVNKGVNPYEEPKEEDKTILND